MLWATFYNQSFGLGLPFNQYFHFGLDNFLFVSLGQLSTLIHLHPTHSVPKVWSTYNFTSSSACKAGIIEIIDVLNIRVRGDPK